MQNFGSEVCKLGSLFEVELSYGFGLVHHTWVVVVHAVDICPYLYFLRAGCRSDKRSRIVASSALQVVHLAIGVAADKALRDIHLALRCFRKHGVQFFFDILCVRLPVLVCTHKVEGREQGCLYSAFLEIVDHHVGTHYLALCHDAFLFEAREQILCERAQIIEFPVQELCRSLFHLIGRIQFLHMLHVFLLQAVDYLVCPFRVFLI